MRPLTMPPRRSVSQARTTRDGGFRRICVANRRVFLRYDALHEASCWHRGSGSVGTVLLVGARASRASRRSTNGARTHASRCLRPHDGDTVDFEAGYIRHLEWHRQAKDTWVWYGWTIWAGERQRWFVYATFGHSAASLDNPVPPAEDERDNISNVTPHAQFVGNALYEYLPGLSRGTGEPQPTARLELTTVDLVPGAAQGVRGGPRRGASHSCRARRSGIGWWRVEPLRAMSGCVRGPACRRFSMEGANRRCPTRSTA